MADESQTEQGRLQVLEARKAQVLECLKSPNLAATRENITLRGYWVDGLAEDLGPAIKRARQHGDKEAFVIQFADALLHDPSDADFTTAFLQSFGAHATLGETREATHATAENISQIAKRRDLSRFQLSSPGGIGYNSLPEGSMLVLGSDGRVRDLVLETKIDGVRLVMDGTAVTNPDDSFSWLRVMLLVKTGNLPPLSQEETKKFEDPRKTWLEIHGREPGQTTGQKDLGRELLDKAAMAKSDLEFGIAVAGASWIPEPKAGNEIMVTPTVLKERPALETEQRRIEAISQALNWAVEHRRLARKGRAVSVVGQTEWSLSIITDVLGMTPEEIIKDGEAMADLLEYLKQSVVSTDKTKGPSDLFEPPPEGHPVMELVYEIEDTWELPRLQGLAQPFVYSRVSWKKRTPQEGN